MSKPTWQAAPTWANWLAKDSSGSWMWYENKPVIHPNECGVWDIESYNHLWQHAGYTGDQTPWTETLEQRS